jgi:hypothetical protein
MDRREEDQFGSREQGSAELPDSMDAGREPGAFVDDSQTLLTRQSPQAGQQSSSLPRRQSVKQD